MAGLNQLDPDPAVTPTNVKKVIKRLTERTCPHCLKEYQIGFNGTVKGCDTCEGIVRLSNGMIDYSASSPEVFVKQVGS